MPTANITELLALCRGTCIRSNLLPAGVSARARLSGGAGAALGRATSRSVAAWSIALRILRRSRQRTRMEVLYDRSARRFHVGRRFHPIAQLFPLLEGEAFDALAADIGVTGLLEPIIEYEGQILDGRNRYRACIQANREPCFVSFGNGDPLTFVLSKNLHRRHLNEAQRAMVAAKLATRPKGSNQHSSIELCSQGAAAEMLHVGSASVKRAAVVREKAVSELVVIVERGEMAVSPGRQDRQ